MKEHPDINDTAKNEGLDAARARSDHAKLFKPFEKIPEHFDRLRWHGKFEETAEPEWLIKGLIPKVGTGLDSGQRSRGKSFVLLDRAYDLAVSKTWTGHRIHENVGTLWIAAEQPRQVPFRLRAFGKDLKLPFTWVPWTSPLLKPDGSLNEQNMEMMIKLAKAAAWGMERDYKKRLGNIAIDTLSRAAGPYNANDGRFAQTLMTAMTTLSVEMEAYVAASDHMGKDESRGTKGSSDKEQFADTVFWYFLNGNKRTMELTKQRDGEDGIAIEFALPTVHLGEDKYGEPIATCKVAWGEWGKNLEPMAKADAPGDLLLNEVICASGGLPKPFTEIRKAFYAKHPAERTGTKQQAFNRAVKRRGATLNKKGEMVESPI